MRAVLSMLLALSTSCSYLAVGKPGPRCEETGADIADGTTAVLSGIVGGIVAIAAGTCIEGCGGDGPQLVGSALALTTSTVVFAASAVHGSRYNDACRRARAAP